MNTTTRELPEYVNNIIAAFKKHGYDCILSGGWLRDFLILREEFDPTNRHMGLYLLPQGGKVVREDLLKKNIDSVVHDCFLQVNQERCNTHYFMDLTGLRARKYIIEVPYRPDCITLSICLLFDDDLETYPEQFVIGLSQCLYDGKRYRVFPGFIKDYENKTITMYSFGDGNRGEVAEKFALGMVQSDYADYEIEQDHS